jgi:hypothetical protein
MEREPKSHEQLGPSPETLAEATERLKPHESSPEANQENQVGKVEAARQQIERQAETAPPLVEAEVKPRPAHPTKFDKQRAYTETMASLRLHLKPAGRRFSKFVHTPVVEKTSEVLEKTVMRPSVTLGATLTALIIGGFVYITAKFYGGFTLSGSEFLFALIIGGLIGAVIELLTKPFRHK